MGWPTMLYRELRRRNLARNCPMSGVDPSLFCKFCPCPCIYESPPDLFVHKSPHPPRQTFPSENPAGFFLSYTDMFHMLNFNTLAKRSKTRIHVIPVKTGIQELQQLSRALDTRFRGYDKFLRDYQFSFTMIARTTI